jgi:HAD superfamily phosphatase (TIGR01668 family)
MAWKESLNAAGITLFLVSNSRKPTRASTFAKSLGIGYIGHAGKPKKGGFQRALAQVGVTAQESAMIGDQIFTDILGANRMEIRSWLIQPVALDTIFRKIRYGFEGLFRVWCKDDRRKGK